MKISVITPSIRPEGLKSIQKCLANQTLTNFEWLVEIGLAKETDFNRAMNRMIKRAQGELLVFYQDFIGINIDGLEKFWTLYKSNPTIFFTGAVNSDWRSEPENQYKKRTFMDWEIDWGSCPREAMFKIGGFDEELDKFWGFDNVNVGLRAEMAGYQIMACDNQAIGLKHVDAPMKRLRNPDYHNFRLDEIRRGFKIDYLSR